MTNELNVDEHTVDPNWRKSSFRLARFVDPKPQLSYDVVLPKDPRYVEPEDREKV